VTDFAALLYSHLPGIYRQKDERDELRRFLAIMAAPLAEVEASIGQLLEDFFAGTCRDELLPLIARLIGAELDPSLPPALQRAALEDSFAFYRNKGLAQPLERTVQVLTGWTTVAVDFSQRVARTPFLDAVNPVVRRRGAAVGEESPGSRRFTFDAGGAAVRLHDEQRGRPITRAEIEARASELLGTEAGLALKERGVDLVGAGAPRPRAAIGADLTDFAAPRTPAGASLSLAPNQIAIDPELGRFLFGDDPAPLAGNLTVDFHQVIAVRAAQTLDLRDASRMLQLGRSDDPAPYTLDLRSSQRPTDKIGRAHYDNHGFFVTVGRRIESQRPRLVFDDGTRSGYTFHDLGTPEPLQLQDGIDGAPLTRARLHGHEDAFFETARGFTIRTLASSLRDPGVSPRIRVRAANLADWAKPLDVDGNRLTLATGDLAVDPELGRFLIRLFSPLLEPDALRVGYLLAPAVRHARRAPAPVSGASANVFAFAADGAPTALRDGIDGTPIAVKLRLRARIADFHGTDRGYRIRVGDTDRTADLVPALQSLEDASGPAADGALALDLERGRFALPRGFVPPGAILTVDFSAADADDEARRFAALAQRLPLMVPAGVSPVIVDSRVTSRITLRPGE